MGCKQGRMDVLLLVLVVVLVGDEIYANIQQFIDSDTCCNYQFNINFCGAVHPALCGNTSAILTGMNFNSPLLNSYSPEYTTRQIIHIII